MRQKDFLHLPSNEWPELCSEWDEDPIELMIKVRRAAELGWEPLDNPYRAEHNNLPILQGFFVQLLARRKENK